jgi:hypothetical protein
MWETVSGFMLRLGPRLPEFLGMISGVSIGMYALLTDARSGLEEMYQTHRRVFKDFSESYRRTIGEPLRFQYTHPKKQWRRIDVSDSTFLVPQLTWNEKPWKSELTIATRAIFWPETLREVRYTPFTAHLGYARRKMMSEWKEYERKGYVQDEGFEHQAAGAGRANAARVGAYCIRRWMQARWVRRGILLTASCAILTGLGAIIALLWQIS